MFSNHLTDYKLILKFKNIDGKFGDLYIGKCTIRNQPVAIKKYCLEKEKDTNLKILCDEINLSRQFKHPNINAILHCFLWQSDIYVLYPFMCFGSCQYLIENAFVAGIPEVLVALILKDTLSALIYMHKKYYVHGAIKANHILLDGHKAVLSSFRECRCFMEHGENTFTLYGLSAENRCNLNWTAPEVLDQNLHGYTEKCDIYSIGITCCEMANGIQPYFDTQPTFMYTEKIRGNAPSLLDQSTCSTFLEEQGDQMGKAFEIYSQRKFSEAFHQFAEICLNRHPSNRWSAQKLSTHSFFKVCKYTCLSDQFKNIGFDLPNSSKVEEVGPGSHETSEKQQDDINWDFS